MSLLRLQLLGPPRAWRDDQLLRFKRRKTLALLAYLGAESGLHARAALAALLWPETAGGDARSSLRTTLVDLRQVLGESALTATREAGGLAPSVALNLDLQTLRQAQGLARALDGAPGLRAQVEQAVALYRGPFLGGLDVPDAPEFETWLEGQRTHWLGVAVELMERLATLQADAGDVGAVQGTLERWVALEPGEERAWQRLLALCLERGDMVGARRSWAACRQALADLDAEPGGALQALAARLGAASGAARPAIPVAPGASSAGWGVLGEAPLVGRAGPLATLRRAFVRTQAGPAQAAVLQGEAGIGKTRLASEFLAWARA